MNNQNRSFYHYFQLDHELYDTLNDPEQADAYLTETAGNICAEEYDTASHVRADTPLTAPNPVYPMAMTRTNGTIHPESYPSTSRNLIRDSRYLNQ